MVCCARGHFSPSGSYNEKDRYGKTTILPVERRRATSAKASAGGTSEEIEKTTDETTTDANARKRKSTGATPLLVVNLEKGTVKMAKNRKKDKAKLKRLSGDSGETIGGEINRHGIGENRPTRRG